MRKLKNWTWVLILLCAIQISATMWGVVERNIILANGIEYKLKVRGFDPYDPFRGSYLLINFEQQTTKINDGDFNPDKTLYLVLKKDQKGLDKIEYATHVKPVGRDYLIAKNSYSNDVGKISYSLPFDAYYVNDSKAKVSEELLQKRDVEAYVTIRVMNGKASLDKLYIEGEEI